MEKFVIFYYLTCDYQKVCVDAESLLDAVSIANAFSHKTGAVIVGICPEFLLSYYYHE